MTSMREPRYDLALGSAALRRPMAHETKVQLRNLSRTGFQTEWLYSLNKGDLLWLKIPGIERLSATVVWIEKFTIGCRFEHPLHPAVLNNIITRCGGREINTDPPTTST